MRYSFGDFVLDAETGELLRSGEVVALRRQTFRLLQLLIERAPALLSRDTLLDEVWGRTALAPNAVPQAISELRRALGDDAQSPQYIETRHGRGYRFIAPVQRDNTPSVQRMVEDQAPLIHESIPSDPRPISSKYWFAYATAFAGFLLIAGWLALRSLAPAENAATAAASRAGTLVLAALPSDAGVPPWVAPAALELFGQHLADSRLRLLRSDALGLVDGAQDLRWQHQAHDLLGADHALGGRWRTESNGNLILDLSVVNLADGQVVVSRKIEGQSENLDAMIAQASAAIASALRIAPLDDHAEGPAIGAEDGADYWKGLTAVEAGNAEQAAATLSALHTRLGRPQWMEAALIKAYVTAGDRESAITLLNGDLARQQTLPLGERLRLQAEVANLRFQPVAAAAAYRALVDLYPDDVESGIHLVESEVDALQGDSARKSLARLAALPATRNDPRLTLLRSRIARLDNDFALAAREAEAALKIAQQYDLPALAVSAALAEAAALNGQGQIDQATRLLGETDQAWSARVDSSSLIALRLRSVQLMREQGHLADAERLIDQLQSDTTAALPRARIGIEAALVQTLSSQVVEADAILQRIKPTIDRSGDPDLSVGWLNADALNAVARNDIDHAQQVFTQAFALSRANGIAGRHVALQVNAGTALVRQKRFVEADLQWQQALETFEALGDRRGQATCLGNLAASSSAQGQLERSVELNTRALALFRDLHLSGPQARTAYNLALAATRDGKLEQASSFFKEAGAAWQADGQNDLVLRAAVGEADIALTSGNSAAATQVLDAVTSVESASPLSQSHLLATKAQIALTQGDLVESRRLHEQSLALRKQDGNEGWIALSELELERNDLLNDHDPLRVQVAAESLARRFAALGEGRDEARAWLLVVDAQLSRNNRNDARRTLDKIKTANKSFSDRALAFDLEWAQAWVSDADERALRLRAIQHRAREEGYVAQALRADQALAARASSESGDNTSAVPVPPYARMREFH